ncbi:AhpC/TSA family protein [Sediminibacterium ginsengisoli]|uniref:AhpC/TSA family protein n=2 Tax=Sediminibacterium ginsengisoli TaxID=413434 RepID=A0A1T4RA64_9BACT|nr:AhpC/TSA family protein [Sediminibacterium ginsengisoli]
MMKKIAGILVLALLFSITLQAQEIRKMKIADVVKMADTSSVPLVINFWATWCGPCVREIPWFEKTVAEFKDQKVRLVLVSLDFADDYPKGIAAFAKKNGYKSDIVWLDETNADLFCPQIDKSWDGAIPVTLMVNNGKRYRQFFGQQLPEQRLLLELKKLVE